MTPASDHRTLLSGTALNVAGLAAGVIAAYGVQLVFARQLPSGAWDRPPQRAFSPFSAGTCPRKLKPSR